MSLFESGWDTTSSTAALVSQSKSHSKERRKSKDRGTSNGVGEHGKSDHAGKANGPVIDLDKLLKKMSEAGGDSAKGKKGKGKDAGLEGVKDAKRGKDGKKGDMAKKSGGSVAGGSNNGRKSKEGNAPKGSSTQPVPETTVKQKGIDLTEPRGEKRKVDESEGSKSKRRKKNKDKSKPAQTEPAQPVMESAPSEEPEGSSELQQLVRKNLQGSKFRIINERLYKSDSSSAHEMIRAEPQLFTEYHVRFRHQTKSWPTNPLNLIHTLLSSLPDRSLVVDLGCGDAQLAKTSPRLNILSFDLVGSEWVIEADICTCIPLPGGAGAKVDAAVCSLSLMSTNWIGCIREAWRVLRMGARFIVAEVTSRFKDTDAFVEVLAQAGFELVDKSAPSTHFLLFEFRKIEQGNVSWESIQSKSEKLLKPCEYKRR